MTMMRKMSRGYKRGGGVNKTTTTTNTSTKEKEKPGIIKKTIGKVRKKFIPTFGEQFKKARDEKKSKFTSTRDDTKKGKLEYSTMTKPEVKKKIAKSKAADTKARAGKGGGADSGAKPVYEKATGTKVSSFGQAFAAAKKAGKNEFTYKGKKYNTRVKGEKSKKILPELSGKTSKKIKKFVGAKKGGLIRGIPKLATRGY